MGTLLLLISSLPLLRCLSSPLDTICSCNPPAKEAVVCKKPLRLQGCSLPPITVMQAAGLQAPNPLRSQGWGLPDPCWGLLCRGPSSAAAARQPLGVMLMDALVRQPSPHLLRASTCWGFCFVLMARLDQCCHKALPACAQGMNTASAGSDLTAQVQAGCSRIWATICFFFRLFILLQSKSHHEHNHTTRCFWLLFGLGFIFARRVFIVIFTYLTFSDVHVEE